MKLSKFAAISITFLTVLITLAGLILFAMSGILNPLIQADIEAGTFDFDLKSFGPMVLNMASGGKVTQALGLWCLYMGLYLLLLNVLLLKLLTIQP